MGTKVDAQLNPNGEYVTSIKKQVITHNLKFRFLVVTNNFYSSMVEIVLTRALSPWLWPNFLFHLSTHGFKSRKALKVIHGLTEKVISLRREDLKNSRNHETQEDDIGLKKKNVFLDILLQSDAGLTDEEIKNEVDTFMFEVFLQFLVKFEIPCLFFQGHDTITSAISFTLYNLSQFKKYQVLK